MPMRIAHALELPVKIDITGDPQKDAEIVLYALAGCVGLLIVCILLLVIIAVRRSRKRKKKAALVLAQQQAQKAAEEKQKQEEIAIAAENTHTHYQPKKEETKAEVAEVTVPVVNDIPVPEPEVKAPEVETPVPEPVQEEVHTHSAHIHVEEDPEKKMEEIRRRIAEIAEKRKTESQEYQEITLPKLGIDYGQQTVAEEKEEAQEFIQAHKWEVEKVTPEATEEEMQQTEEPGYAPEDHDMQVPEVVYTESGHSDMWIHPETETILQHPEPQSEEPVYAPEHIHTAAEDVAAEHHLPPATEIPVPHLPAGETGSEAEPVVLQANKDLDGYFQNTQLPLKRLTFAEWVDQFKK